MAGDEHEAAGHLRLNLTHRQVKHITGHAGHEHVADDHVEIHFHDLAQPAAAIVRRGYNKVVRLEQFLEGVGEFQVVVEEEDVLDLEFGSFRHRVRGHGHGGGISSIRAGGAFRSNL